MSTRHARFGSIFNDGKPIQRGLPLLYEGDRVTVRVEGRRLSYRSRNDHMNSESGGPMGAGS